MKHQVLGKKIKGSIGKPGLARKTSQETRKKTLLTELNAKDHVSQMVDKRFGESNPSLSMEDKMLQRFVKEKKSRTDYSGIFNLEEENLTHMGQSLSNIDMEAGLHDDDSEGTLLQIVSRW